MSKKTIRVYLDTDLNPPVQVDHVVRGRSAVRWKREKGSMEFDFDNIVFLDPDNPFSNIKVSDKRIRADNALNEGNWHYEITVKDANGTAYSSTQTGNAPDGGRPVIRN